MQGFSSASKRGARELRVQPGRRLPRLGTSVVCVFLAGAAAAWAQAAQPPAQEGTGGETAKDESSWTTKVAIHGYLSQAYAFSDGNQILGIPEDGTADYRTAALQVRAEMTANDTFAIQLSHERNGLSPSQSVHDDVELDWVFYRRQFGNSSIAVGRVPVPFGIYNEVRDVGTVLPFYRPPRSFYAEGAFATETVDGVLLSHGLDLGESWHFDGDLYYGNWESFDSQQNLLKMSDTAGVQLFLETPVSGLRLGAGGSRFENSAMATLPRSRWTDYHGSVQGSFGRLEGEVEYRRLVAKPVAGGTLYDVKSGYVRLGVRLTDRLSLQSLYERFKLKLAILPSEVDFDKDRVLALSYKFRPDLVLKAEHHWNKGYFLDAPANFAATVPKTKYGILSLSTSF